MRKIGNIILGMTVLLLCMETTAFAQGINKEQIYRMQFRKQIDKETRNAEARMANSIADLTRACELSKQQAAKLEVAAKGAIKAVLAPTKERLIKQAQKHGFEFDPDAPAEEEKELGPESPNQIAQRLLAAGGSSLSVGKSKVDEEKIWVKSLDKVLTDEQKTKWTTWTGQRNAFTRKAAVFHIVALADQQLLFSEEQREGMSAYLEKRYGDSLVANFGNSAPGRAQLILAQSLQKEGGEETGGNEAVKAILTESQFKLWNSLFEPRLNRPIRRSNLRD